jgi:hypothetical protein
MESRKDVCGAPLHRVVLRRALRLVADFGGIPIIIAIVVGLLMVMFWAFSAVSDSTGKWFSSIEDPTERGLAYIAAAIVLHAIFGKSTVDVKVDGKRP